MVLCCVAPDEAERPGSPSNPSNLAGPAPNLAGPAAAARRSWRSRSWRPWRVPARSTPTTDVLAPQQNEDSSTTQEPGHLLQDRPAPAKDGSAAKTSVTVKANDAAAQHDLAQHDLAQHDHGEDPRSSTTTGSTQDKDSHSTASEPTLMMRAEPQPTGGEPQGPQDPQQDHPASLSPSEPTLMRDDGCRLPGRDENHADGTRDMDVAQDVEPVLLRDADANVAQDDAEPVLLRDADVAQVQREVQLAAAYYSPNTKAPSSPTPTSTTVPSAKTNAIGVPSAQDATRSARANLVRILQGVGGLWAILLLLVTVFAAVVGPHVGRMEISVSDVVQELCSVPMAALLVFLVAFYLCGCEEPRTRTSAGRKCGGSGRSRA